VRWKCEYHYDFKAIMKSDALGCPAEETAKSKPCKEVSKCKHRNLYEMIAYTGVARLMFFYDDTENATEEHEKSRGDQDAAFQRCADLRDLYVAYENERRKKSQRQSSLRI
jgi:hypothetical protein